MSNRALFAGVCTLDIVQAVQRLPGPNEKTTAIDQSVAAGGPATNAAVTFAHLGGQATLLTGVGDHPLAAGMRADLAEAHVSLIDVAGSGTGPPSVSTIMVLSSSGDRSVVSRNAVGWDLDPPNNLDALVAEADAVLVDGHHPKLAVAAARQARAIGRLCILDAGSWKDVTAELLPYVDVAVCSADFRPPGTSNVPDYLSGSGVGWTAITNGPEPVIALGAGTRAEIPVPAVAVRDTLGAGDVFHGAFVSAACASGGLDWAAFTSALDYAAAVASRSCEYFGTRAWLTAPA